MNIDGVKIDKARTRRRIERSMPRGWKLVGINWKKHGKAKVADPHGRLFHIPITKPDA